MLVEVCVCVFLFALYKELIGSYLIKKKMFDDIKASRYSKRHEKESKFFFFVCVSSWL